MPPLDALTGEHEDEDGGDQRGNTQLLPDQHGGQVSGQGTRGICPSVIWMCSAVASSSPPTVGEVTSCPGHSTAFLLVETQKGADLAQDFI